MNITGNLSSFSNVHTSAKQIVSLENEVLSKDKAIKQIFGYGVDSKGYFTEEFNKAANIPKDYKIHSDIAGYFEKIANYDLAFFSSFDIAKTLGKHYEAFTQVFSGINAKQGINEEDFLNLPVAFDYSFDEGEFSLHKIYDLDEYKASINNKSNEKISQRALFFANDPRSSNDFTRIDFKSFRTNEDGSINKGELLVEFFSQANLGIIGESSIAGKIMGASGEELAQELRAFIRQNSLFGFDIGGLIPDTPETMALFNSNLSPEEFKEKWLELKEKMSKAQKKADTNAPENENFKALQVKSSTRNDEIITQFAHNQQKIQLLAMLFESPKNSFDIKSLARLSLNIRV